MKLGLRFNNLFVTLHYITKRISHMILFRLMVGNIKEHYDKPANKLSKTNITFALYILKKIKFNSSILQN